MQDCKPVKTPVSVGNKLNKATDSDECVDQTRYQSAIGSLMYLSVSTRPDVLYAVSSLARFNSKPTRDHWTALKRLLRYLQHMEFSTVEMVSAPASAIQTQTGLGTLMIENQLLDMYFC